MHATDPQIWTSHQRLRFLKMQLKNSKDAQGKTWLETKRNCFVTAALGIILWRAQSLVQVDRLPGSRRTAVTVMVVLAAEAPQGM